MLDPITAIATATAAFNGVKKLVAAGRELEDCMGQMAQWYTALSDLGEAERNVKNPPLFKRLTSKKSVEQEALEIFAHRRKVQAQEKELREIILFAYGKDAWIELIGLRRRIRLERERAIYAQQRKRKDTFWTAVTIIVLTFLCYGFYATLSFVVNEMRPPNNEQQKD